MRTKPVTVEIMRKEYDQEAIPMNVMIVFCGQSNVDTREKENFLWLPDF